ncbi:Smr/MutS family protein [Phenylobacterium aquaticum]|uniref:Smr/MutS family protein n=1 Tax=Phenylobacterium aquaticum TaxID=1763816 RepID=UPI001F5CF1D2|nr:Smr/MutS family protein [Phenylobacterium aquaticum]
MKRPIRAEELRLWTMVAQTVHPLPGRALPRDAADPPAPPIDPQAPAARIPPPERPAPRKGRTPPLDPIEPGRKHRIAKEREEIGARIDLHGLTQDRARAALEGFIRRNWDEGHRAVLVITGKGLRGDGILRRATPEWLAAPALREMVAGVSEAHRHHGGGGALYVALKRRPRP